MPPVVLITGASSGIGRVSAQYLAARGCQVFGTSRQPDPASAPPGVIMLKLDVHSEESVQACVAEVLAQAGRLDVLVNNAGLDFLGAVEETTLAEAQAHFDTNFFGAVRMMRAVLPQMRAQGSGKIISMSSGLGIAAAPFQGLYTAAKQALEAYSEALWYEVEPLGIQVAIVEPAFYKTNITQNMGVAAGIEDYAPWREALYQDWYQRTAKAPSPEPVAETIYRIVQSPRPRLRYPVGFDSWGMEAMRRLLPFQVQAEIIRLEMGLGSLPRLLQRLAPLLLPPLLAAYGLWRAQREPAPAALPQRPLPTDVRIRRASPADAPAILGLMQRLSSEAGHNLRRDADEVSSSPEAESASIAELNSQPNGGVWVAEAGLGADPGTIIGVLTCSGGTLRAELHNTELGIFVDADWRGRGVGAALMRQAIAWARQSDVVKRITLFVMARHSRAIRLYEGLGFRVEGRMQKDMFRDGEYLDTLIMALLLD